MVQPDASKPTRQAFMYVSKSPGKPNPAANEEQHPADRELLAQFADPTRRHWAFNQLVHKYQRRVYAHVRKMVIDHDDADDLTQETFVKAWHHLGNFRGEAQLYTWLYRIASNECLNFLNKKRRRFFVPIHDVRKELATKLDQGGDFTGDEIQLKLQKALLVLPDKQKLVFNLKYFDELSYEEISEITDTSVGALKASYHHAVKKIEAFLQNSIHSK
ncbi:MAG: sigma-70 family RNA polymerase sigma factor [Bernardetiaceae bacterium]|nr:sigma-70 family RNA polymerase sigma factor [Bernardetiaceae bacterium]